MTRNELKDIIKECIVEIREDNEVIGETISFVSIEKDIDIKNEEKYKSLLPDIKKRFNQIISDFIKDSINTIKIDFEDGDLKDRGYKIPSSGDISKNIELKDLKFYIYKEDSILDFWIISHNIKSGNKKIDIDCEISLRYDKDNNLKPYTKDSNYHSDLHIDYIK